MIQCIASSDDGDGVKVDGNADDDKSCMHNNPTRLWHTGFTAWLQYNIVVNRKFFRSKICYTGDRPHVSSFILFIIII